MTPWRSSVSPRTPGCEPAFGEHCALIIRERVAVDGAAAQPLWPVPDVETDVTGMVSVGAGIDRQAVAFFVVGAGRAGGLAGEVGAFAAAVRTGHPAGCRAVRSRGQFSVLLFDWEI